MIYKILIVTEDNELIDTKEIKTGVLNWDSTLTKDFLGTEIIEEITKQIEEEEKSE